MTTIKLDYDDMEDERFQRGLDSLVKFEWIKRYGKRIIKTTDEWSKVFIESYEDIYVNPDREFMEKEYLAFSHPIIQEDMRQLDESGVDVSFLYETSAIAKRMLEKIGELDNPSPDNFHATFLVLMKVHQLNESVK